MHVWKVCIRPDPGAPDVAQGYVLAANKKDAFAIVDHPDAEVFEADFRALSNVRLWHKADAPPRPRLGPLIRRLPTFGVQCRLTAAFQTQRQAVSKVAV